MYFLDFYNLEKILEEFFKKLPLRESSISDYAFKINDLYQEIIDTIFYYKNHIKYRKKIYYGY